MMENFSKFKLFKSGPYYRLGTIYAIVTGSKTENSNDIETEWYYFTTHSRKIGALKISSQYFKTIDNFWDNYTVESLKEAIYFDQIVPVLEEIKDFSFYTKVELQEIKNENIIYLSIENMDFIDYLKKYTSCTELKNLVDVLPIIKLEKREVK